LLSFLGSAEAGIRVMDPKMDFRFAESPLERRALVLIVTSLSEDSVSDEIDTERGLVSKFRRSELGDFLMVMPTFFLEGEVDVVVVVVDEAVAEDGLSLEVGLGDLEEAAEDDVDEKVP